MESTGRKGPEGVEGEVGLQGASMKTSAHHREELKAGLVLQDHRASLDAGCHEKGVCLWAEQLSGADQFPKKADWWLTAVCGQRPQQLGEKILQSWRGSQDLYDHLRATYLSAGEHLPGLDRAPSKLCPLDLLPSCTGLPCSYLSNEGLISRFKRDSLLTESGPYVWFGLVFSLLKFETLLSMFKKLGDFPKIPDFWFVLKKQKIWPHSAWIPSRPQSSDMSQAHQCAKISTRPAAPASFCVGDC